MWVEIDFLRRENEETCVFVFQVEKEVIECMNRALKYLDVELNFSASDRSPLAKYRAGTIHHRLASLLHNSFRSEV